MSRPTPLIAALVLAAVLLPAVAQHTGTAHPAPGTAHTHAANSAPSRTPLPLTATKAWIVAVPPGVTETSAFMTLRNTGNSPLILSRVQSGVARHAMLMVTRRDSRGLTGMRTAATLTVPARGTLTLRESGDHLMLMDLKRPLKVGETLRLRLGTRNGRSLDVQAVVRKP